MNIAAIPLPGGVWSADTLQRTVFLRPLCGLDQLFWVDQPGQVPLPRRIHTLLARCVLSPGEPTSAQEGNQALVGSLTIGDREALLLHLHRISFGSRIECVLACPHCAEKLDLELAVEALLLPPYASPQPEYSADLQGYNVRFRLPTGDDQVAIAGLASADLDAAEQALLRRCLLDVSFQGQPAELPVSLIPVLADRMSELDPQAELDIQMTCPACASVFSSLLDMSQFLGAELANRSRPIDHEIHALALAYHWSEAEILGLSIRRRQIYLQLLDEAGILVTAAGAS